jgi:hypothetical protein
MVISSKPTDMTGNHVTVDGIQLAWDAMTNVAIPVATQPSICAGTGVPTFSAKKGTVYIRLDGAAATMLYVNNNGATTWSVVTSA